MDIIIPAVKYVFVVAFGVEIILIARAVFQLGASGPPGPARAAQAEK